MNLNYMLQKIWIQLKLLIQIENQWLKKYMEISYIGCLYKLMVPYVGPIFQLLFYQLEPVSVHKLSYLS